MATKRGHVDLDPDYEDVTERQSKRQRVLEDDAKEATSKKIQNIITEQFDQEVYNKETEIDEADQRIHHARLLMDRLRACIVANYYGSAGQQRLSKGNVNQLPSIHPSVKNVIGKRPRETIVKTEPGENNDSLKQQLQSTPLSSFLGKMNSDQSKASTQNGLISQSQIKCESSSSIGAGEARSSRFKIKKRIIVGNVSKFIPMDRREEDDHPTHKWMVYVRGPPDSPDISQFVQKVWFFLHPSYRPNDLVEVSQPPFHLTRRGWGEFPLRVQLHFKDQRNKRLDIIHNLKLDRTYTGLQTLGAETVVDIELERDRISEKLAANMIPSRVTCLAKQVAPRGTGSDGSSENNVTIQEGSSPNKIQSMPLLAEHLLGKIPTNENSNTSILSDKENLCNENLTKDNPSNAAGSVQFSGSLLEGNRGPQGKQTESVTVKSLIPPQKAQVIGQSTSTAAAKLSVSGKQNNTLLIKSNSTSLIKIPIQQGQGSQVKVTPQPTLILASSVPNRCVTSSQNTQTTSVAMATLTTATTGSHSGAVVTSSVSGTSAEQTLYVRCSDNQGNVFLVPQHMLKHLPGVMSPEKTQTPSVTKSAAVSVSSTVQSSTTATTVVRPTPQVTGSRLTLASSLTPSQQPKGGNSTQTVVLTNTNPGIAANKEKGQILLSLGGSLIASGVQTQGKRSGIPIIQGQGQQSSGPVLLIKTDQPGKASNLTLIAKPQGTTTPGLQSPSPSGTIRLQLQGNIVQPVRNVKVQGHSVAKSQGPLKVTSQGLKSVDQKVSPSIGVGTSSNSTSVTVTDTKQADKVARNCQLASLLTGEISLANRKPVQLSTAINKAVATTTKSNTDGLVITSPAKSVSSGNVITSAGALTTSSPLLPQTAKFANATSLLKPGLQTSTAGTSSSSNVQSKTVLAKIGNQTLILQLPVTETKTLTSNDKGVKGQGQQHTVTLNLKPGCEEQKVSPALVVQKENTTGGKSSTSNKENLISSSTKKIDGMKISEEKSILNLKKNRNLSKPPTPNVPKVIKPINVNDFPDMASLVRAAVMRHPIVDETANRNQHPYCARDVSQWLEWNPGKRRASEWQRASTCRRFLQKFLGAEEFHKGTKLWTTKQIMIWCRMHAYSPHYMEKPLHPTGVDLTVEETKVGAWFSTVTDPGQIHIPVVSGQSTQGEDSDSEVDIIAEEPPKVKVKVEKEEESLSEPQFVLEPDAEDKFIQNTAKKIGVIFEPCPVDGEVHAPVSEKLLFNAMKCFARDLIQESFARKINQGRYPDGLGILDFYKALSSLPAADFTSNKHLGVSPEQK